jgi:hypothetical protein
MPDPANRLRAGVDPSTPRWVKVFGIIGLVLVLLFIILHLVGGGLRGHRSAPDGTAPGVRQP